MVSTGTYFFDKKGLIFAQEKTRKGTTYFLI